MRKKLIALFLSIFILMESVTQVYAVNYQHFYSIDLDSITSNVDGTLIKRYIGSLVCVEDGHSGIYHLMVNNEDLGTFSGSATFNYYPNIDVRITISVSLNDAGGTATFDYTKVEETTITTRFDFDMSSLSVNASNKDAINQYVTISTNGSTETKSCIYDSNNICDFGTYTYNYKGIKTISYPLKINASAGKVYIGDRTYNLSGSGTIEQPLFVETNISAHELDLNYLEIGLPKYSYETAKSITYSEGQIDAAVSNEKLHLTSNVDPSKYFSDEDLVQYITYWERTNPGAAIGDGVYDTSVEARQIKVICQWYDSDCAEIRAQYGEANRPFAVYPNEFTFTVITKKQDTVSRYVDETSEPQLAFPSGKSRVEYDYRNRTVQPVDTGWVFESEYNALIDDTEIKNVTNYQTRDATRYTYRAYTSWTDWYPSSEAPYWYGYWGTNNYETQTGSTIYKYKYETKNTTVTDWVTATPGSEAYPYTSYDYKTQWACAYYVYSNWVDTVNSKSGSYQSACALKASYGQDQNSVCGYRTITTYKCPTSRSENTCTITSASACGYKYCQTSACGVDYYNYKTCQTSACGKDYDVYKSCRNSQCGVESQTYKACRNSACGVESYNACSRCGAKSCTYSVRAANCSKCGKNWRGKCKTCTYSVYGQNGSKCGYVACSACGVNQYKSCRTSGCGVESTTYKSCRVYACGVDYTVYKSCQNSACGVASTVYRYCTHSDCGTKTCTVTSGSSCGYSFTWGSKSTSKYGSYQTNCQVNSNDTMDGYYKSCAVYTCPQTRGLSAYSAWSDSSCTSDSVRTRTLYKYTNITYDWSSWSSWVASVPSWVYNAYDYEVKSDTQVRTRKYDVKITNWYAGSSCTGSDCPRQEDVITSQSYQNVYGKPYQYRATINYYKYSNWANNWKSTSGALSSTDSTQYRYRYIDRILKKVLVDVADINNTVKITNPSRMTTSEILEFARQLNIWSAMENLEEAARKYYDQPNVTFGELYEYASRHEQSGNRGNEWLQQGDFIPYLFIKSHIRANIKTFSVTGYNDVSETVRNTFDEVTNGSGIVGNLIMSAEPIERSTKVIYYDYTDPLYNYDELPENWEGYESLIEEIKNSDMDNYKFQVVLSADDIKRMKEYTKEHSSEIGNGSCDMLREFSYIFTFSDNSSSLKQWLESGEGCKIEDD